MRAVGDWGAFLLIPATRYGGSGAAVDARRDSACRLAVRRARFRSDIAPSSPLSQPHLQHFQIRLVRDYGLYVMNSRPA